MLVFVTRDGTLLLGRRRAGVGAGTWGLPGGHLEHGEGLEDAARRELLEETGLTATRLVFRNVVNRTENGVQYIHVSFLAEGVNGEPELREPDACSDWKWFPLSSLPQPVFSWNAGPIEAFMRQISFTDIKHDND